MRNFVKQYDDSNSSLNYLKNSKKKYKDNFNINFLSSESNGGNEK